jgi:hypothetical protein
MLETTKLPWHDGHQARKQLAEEFENEVSSSWLGRVRQPVSTAFDPTLTKPFDYAIRVMAAMRTADACLAAEQYRRREGDFPKSLDHLVPAYLASIPEDPFDGEPLRYIVRDSECVVYSIGMNERDDGGNEVAFTLRPDITFTVRNPAASIESAAEQVEVPVSAGSDNPKDAPPEGGTPTQQN